MTIGRLRPAVACRPTLAAAFAVLATVAAVPARAQSSAAVETVVVTANAPLPGSEIDADKIAGDVDILSIPDLTRDRYQDVLPSTVAAALPSVSLNDEQGTPFQPDLVYRGFEASPIGGVAEGLAVNEDGVRLNESLGDSVNWDLIPDFAVDRLTIQSNNPAFGLNALGGAVTLAMKSGLSFDGSEAQLSGGSFGNVTGDAQFGARSGPFGFYFGVGGLHDGGYRFASQTSLGQAYGDLAYAADGLTLHLSLSGALDDIAAPGPTPVELLAQDRRAVFTTPQSMRNATGLVALRGTYQASAILTLSFSAYDRHFTQDLVDGNTTDVVPCTNDAAQLCLEGRDEFPADALYDTNGDVVPASVLPPGATPGEIDRSRTRANAFGVGVQASLDAPIAGLPNKLVVGGSLDQGATDYAAHGELGALANSLVVTGAGVIIDQSFSPTASPPIEAPAHIGARNTYGGLYAIDVLDVTRALALTVSARLNTADIRIVDRLGGTAGGRHGYSHLNPGVGAAYKVLDNMTAYAGYSESNRAPTAGELACADPAAPCILDAFLVADPPLKQVVSRNVELGLRGRFAIDALPGTFVWKAGVYRNDSANDILLVATAINGFGFFENAGTTRRQGADLRLSYHDPRWTVTAGYAHLDATFQNALTVASNSPAADANGNIRISPGDHIPLNPANRVTLTVNYVATPRLSLGADLRAQSGQYLAGDESNQEPRLPGATTLDLHGSYDLWRAVSLFGEIENLFETRTYTYGTFTQLDNLPPAITLTNPRSLSPGPGRLFYAGLRAKLD